MINHITMNNLNRGGNRSHVCRTGRAGPSNNFLRDELSRQQPLYGIHSFNNNQDAHSFINSALNSGRGYTGGVSTGFHFANPGSAQATRFAGSGSSAQFNGGARFNGPNGPVPFPARSFLNVQPINIHPFDVGRSPIPESCMMVIASIDTPIRPSEPLSGVPPSPCPSNDSGASSQSSVYNLSMSSRGSGSPCQCPKCKGCVCHLYCEDHAQVRCPVHGLGRGSSGESNSSNSPHSQSGISI